MSPEAPKLDDTPSRKRVKITEAEKRLFKVADPNGPEIQAFLLENGLKFGDEIIADVEGQDEPEVFDLSEKDFFDTIREDKLEQGERDELREEASEDLAETSFELVGPEDPAEGIDAPVVDVQLAEAPAGVARDMLAGHPEESPDSDTPEVSTPSHDEQLLVKADYDTTTDRLKDEAHSDIMQSFRKLDGVAQEIDGMLSATRMLDDDADTIRRISLRIESGDYGADTAITALQQVIESLHGVRTRLLRVAPEGGLGEVKQYLDRIVTTATETSAALTQRYEAVTEHLDAVERKGAVEPAEKVEIADISETTKAYDSILPPTDELKAAAGKLEGDTTEGQKQLNDIITHLDGIIAQARNYPINVEEVRAVSAQLVSLAENLPKSPMTPLLEQYGTVIKSAIHRAEAA